MSDKSKLEREIDEILEKSGDDGADKRGGPDSSNPRVFEPFSPTVPKQSRPERSSGIVLDPGMMLLVGLLVLLVAAFAPTARFPIAVIGIALVGFGYYMSIRRGRFGGGGAMFRRSGSKSSSTNDEPPVKYWRGRRIEDSPQRPDADRGKIIDFGSPHDDDK